MARACLDQKMQAPDPAVLFVGQYWGTAEIAQTEAGSQGMSLGAVTRPPNSRRIEKRGSLISAAGGFMGTQEGSVRG